MQRLRMRKVGEKDGLEEWWEGGYDPVSLSSIPFIVIRLYTYSEVTRANIPILSIDAILEIGTIQR